MILNIIYIILALVGLSFIVLIHELGHLIVAVRNGVCIEVFSIGFGKPIVEWEWKQIRWRLSWIPFGGYVKPKGQESDGKQPVHEIEGGFFASSPWVRIKIAAMGPIVNIVFSLIAFTCIWMLGGRLQPFARHTKIIGWIDPKSELYQEGIRPGDELSKVDGHSFKGFQDLLYAAVTAPSEFNVQGYAIDYTTKEQTPFSLPVHSYPDPRMQDDNFRTFGVFTPASYLIYDDFSEKGDNPLYETSPMIHSGIQPKDRIIWVNGEMIFSLDQLKHVLNKTSVVLKIVRNHKEYDVEVPRYQVRDLRFTRDHIQELGDWQHEIGLEGSLLDLYFIPFSVTSKGVIDHPIKYIDDASHEVSLTQDPSFAKQMPLQRGDQILAIDGIHVQNGYEVLKNLQNRMARIIVQRGIDTAPMLWKNEDKRFIDSVNGADLSKTIALASQGIFNRKVGQLVLLNPVNPKPKNQILSAKEYQGKYEAFVKNEEDRIASIKDPKKRQVAQVDFQTEQNQRFLGIALQDRQVVYNPNPLLMMGYVAQDMARTLSSLVSGNLHPKWLSGPVGFMQVMHRGMTIGFKEALYWLGLISLGLAIFNLLPIPSLDGGYIVFSLYEMITRKRISPTAMERLIIPFFILLVGLLIFVTYQDIMRIFSGLMK